MKSFIAATFVAAVAAQNACPGSYTPPATTTSAAAQPASTSPVPFSGLAIRSGSPIQYASINASDLNFWIGKNTSTANPQNLIPTPKDPVTAFFINKEFKTVSLDAEVPGGQQVYVDTSAVAQGALKFTQAHSGNIGTTGVSNEFSVSGDSFEFEGQGFIACPSGKDVYQVFAASRNTNNSTECLGFKFRTVEYNTTEPEAVWQYA